MEGGTRSGSTCFYRFTSGNKLTFHVLISRLREHHRRGAERMWEWRRGRKSVKYCLLDMFPASPKHTVLVLTLLRLGPWAFPHGERRSS